MMFVFCFRMERNYRARIKKKIIERKYFKPEAETNLLTWAAKEQICFLSQEYPDEWNPDRISESFPISREGVIRLLKSSYSPRTQEELLRHDRRVRKSWLALKSTTGVDGGPVYQQLQTQKILPLMVNADGIASLPRPETKKLPSLGLISPGIDGGIFESIVKDYFDLKKQSDYVALADNQSQSDDKARLLRSIAGSSKYTDNKQHHVISETKLSIRQPSGIKRKQPNPKLDSEWFHDDWNAIKDHKSKYESQRNRSYEDLMRAEKDHISHSKDASLEWDREMVQTHGENLLKDVEQMTTQIVKTRVSRKERRLMNLRDDNNQANIKSPGIEALQMNGTNKVGVTTAISREESENWNREHYHNENTVNVAYSSKQPDNVAYVRQRYERDVFNNLKVDQHRTVKTSGVKDVYMYDSVRGYQNPLGKYDESLENIDMRKEKQSAGAAYAYRKGDTVYDDDGEFLYRIP